MRRATCWLIAVSALALRLAYGGGLSGLDGDHCMCVDYVVRLTGALDQPSHYHCDLPSYCQTPEYTEDTMQKKVIRIKVKR